MTSRSWSRRYLLAPAEWGGFLVSVLAALLLLSRFGSSGSLGRDEAVYAYAGEQLARGVLPYVSIFDPKGPGAGLLAGAAAYLAGLFGGNDLAAIRTAFFLFACATVAASYLLALRLFESVLGGIATAVVMASFHGWALDAFGPDAKVPGIFFIVLSMFLMAGRRWEWAAFAGSLAFLVWQPLFVLPTLAVVLAGLSATGRRRLVLLGRALSGAVAPVLAVLVWYAVAGSLGKLIDAGLVFPLVGRNVGTETIPNRARHIVSVVEHYYGQGGVAWTFWLGALALAVLVAYRVVRRRAGALPDPLVSVVAVSGLAETMYALIDFQSNADVFPLLPYPALGIGGAVAVAVAWSRRRGWQLPVRLAAGALVVALTAGTAVQFQREHDAGTDGLRSQLEMACGIARMLGPSGRLWALGDPSSLVLTDRTNPDRFIYLSSGVDAWKVAHLPGGFASWTAEIRSVHPAVLVMHDWRSALKGRMLQWLQHDGGYQLRWLGTWRVFVTPAARLRARQLNVRLTRHPTYKAFDRVGRSLPPYHCRVLEDYR